MVDILVAIGFNLIAVLILVSGIFSALKNGVRVSLVKFILTLGAGVGCYFLIPTLVDKITPITVNGTTLGTIFSELGISIGTISSIVFTLCFLAFYAFILIICNIVRHALIKKLRNKNVNKAKMARAKSINSRAEKAARKSEWKSLKFKFKENRKWYHKVIAIILGAIVAVVVGFVTLLPIGYIGNDLEADTVRNGYKYTLNGVICDGIEDFDFGDWVLHIEGEEPTHGPVADE